MGDAPDLTTEEWEALLRLNRGQPEAGLVPSLIFDRLAQLGLASYRAGRRRVSDRGKQLILRARQG